MSKQFLIWAEDVDLSPDFKEKFDRSEKKILRVVKSLAEYEGLITAPDNPLKGQEWSLLCYGSEFEDLVSRVKRHPEFHLAPVFIIKAGVRPEEVEAAQKKGVFAVVEKDDFSALETSIAKYDAVALPRDSLKELDTSFVDELRDQAHEMRTLSQELNAERMKELYRVFHTVKGTAKSLQFPHLGNFMHQGEEILNLVKSELCFKHPFVTEILNGIYAYLQDQAEQLRVGRLLELPSNGLVKKMETFLGRVLNLARRALTS